VKVETADQARQRILRRLAPLVRRHPETALRIVRERARALEGVR